jgi:putative transposase
VIDAEKASYKISWMCALLGVPRSSFYAWRHRTESPTAARRRELAAQVGRVFEAGRGAYGCRRVTAQLNREGIECSAGPVADLMREAGLRACQPRAYKRTTIPGREPARPDLIGRDFTAAAPGQRLVGDITYLRTGEGWLYLATVIDPATRMVTGWQLADHMRTSLITDALDMAVTHGHVAPGAVFHSDRGRPVYVGRVHPVLPLPRHPAQHRPDRGVLGQRSRGELLRLAEKRDVLPAGLPRPGPRPVRRRRVHRGLLQPPAAALHPRLPDPAGDP